MDESLNFMNRLAKRLQCKLGNSFKVGKNLEGNQSLAVMKNLLLLGNFLQILREEAWLVLCLVSRRMMLMIKQSARSFLLQAHLKLNMTKMKGILSSKSRDNLKVK